MSVSDRVTALLMENAFRRESLLRAVTADFNLLLHAFDPDAGPLVLHGLSDRSWCIASPIRGAPPPMPQPRRGLNRVRDRMRRDDWAALVALHCDQWLYATAMMRTAQAGLSAAGRAAVFARLNSFDNMMFQAMAWHRRSPTRHHIGLTGRVDDSHIIGRLLTREDVCPDFKGRRLLVYWPDEDRWFPCTVVRVAWRSGVFRVKYRMGHSARLKVDVVLHAGHVKVLD